MNAETCPDALVAELLKDLQLVLDDQGVTAEHIADTCGCDQLVASEMLSGDRELTVSELVKLASMVGCVWRLQRPHFGD